MRRQHGRHLLSYSLFHLEIQKKNSKGKEHQRPMAKESTTCVMASEE
jgi:hypothetical protein